MSAMGTITVVGGFFTIWAFILTWNSRRNHKFQKEVLDKMDAHLEKLAQLVKDGQVFLAQIGQGGCPDAF